MKSNDQLALTSAVISSGTRSRWRRRFTRRGRFNFSWR
jgi:hypothetical protein